MPDFVSSVSRQRRRPLLAANSSRQLLIPSFILLAVLFADQITKIWAANSLLGGKTIQVIGEFFQLKLVFNTGGALGTELGSSTFYLISSILILGFVIYFTASHRSIKFIAWPMASIAGGAVGNILDRIRLGKVIDFLDFDFFDISFFGRNIERWWTFNIADAAITIGIFTIMFYLIFLSKKTEIRETISADNKVNSPEDL